MKNREWLYFSSAALVSELCGTWLQSSHHAMDVPFAVTYTTRSDYAIDRLVLWTACFVPLMVIAAFLLGKRNRRR